MRLDIIYPGGNLKFQFYLEDAYGAESSEGHKMAVSWESQYIGDIIDTSAYKDAKGEQVLEGEKKYMFPPKWDITVSLPLKEGAEEKTEKIEVTSSNPDSNLSRIANLPDSSRPISKIDLAEKSIPDKKSYFWWLLLLPLLLSVKYFTGLKK